MAIVHVQYKTLHNNFTNDNAFKKHHHFFFTELAFFYGELISSCGQAIIIVEIVIYGLEFDKIRCPRHSDQICTQNSARKS